MTEKKRHQLKFIWISPLRKLSKTDHSLEVLLHTKLGNLEFKFSHPLVFVEYWF